MIISKYCYLNDRKIHYLTAGKGAPIVLLHPSPSSSKIMIPLIKILATHFTVIAPDTPGYGQSGSLPETPIHLKDYCQYFHQFFKAIGLSKFAIYGSATGAQIAIRYGLEFPDEVSHLYLDNAAHFTEAQKTEIVKSYFPDISPRYDGSHLMTVWTMVRDLFTFFPWCFSKPKYRLNIPSMPAVFLPQVALDYMEAGSDYHLAYRLAFEHEKAEYVQGLKVPTSLFHWEASIVKPYIEQLVAFDLPENVEEVSIPKDRIERYEKMKDCMVDSFEKGNWPEYVASGYGLNMAENIEHKSTNEFISNLPKLEPDENGTYLINAWFYLRDRQLYKNPNEKTMDNRLDSAIDFDASNLQSQLIEWMKR